VAGRLRLVKRAFTNTDFSGQAESDVAPSDRYAYPAVMSSARARLISLFTGVARKRVR
jgi:hypothetical protein